MEQHSQVLVARVEYDGSAHEAPYFVEHNIIRANIDGRMMTVPISTTPPGETVKALLSGYLSEKSRKLRHISQWMA